MPQKYAPAVKNVLNALKSLIEARATADGITVGEVRIGEKAQDRTFLKGGIYLLLPDDREPRHPAGSKREPQLSIPVMCIHRGTEDNPSTLAVLDLAGLVIDTVLANPTLSGTCMSAQASSSESGTADLDDAIAYAATVTVTARIQHAA